ARRAIARALPHSRRPARRSSRCRSGRCRTSPTAPTSITRKRRCTRSICGNIRRVRWAAISKMHPTKEQSMNQKHPLEGLSRRHFLHTAMAGATVAALPNIGSAGQRQKEDPYGGFTVGVQSYTFRQFNLERTLGIVRDLGLHYIELYSGHIPTNSTE